MARETGEAEQVRVKDAYVLGSNKGQRWTIGTDAVEQVFQCEAGRFRLTSFKNKLQSPYLEYADGGASTSLFEMEAGQLMERFAFEKLWSDTFARRETIHPVATTSIAVRSGEVIGFRVDKMDQQPSSLKWNISVDYEGGALVEVPGKLALSDGVMYTHNAGALEDVADGIPGGVAFNLGENRNLMRVWVAPRDGTVRVGGSLVSGSHGNLDIGIYRVKTIARKAVLPSDCSWTVESGEARELIAGGRPAVQLDLKLKSSLLRVYLHFLVYPGTSIIRQWIEIENSGPEPYVLKSPAQLFLNLRADAPWTNYWMTGGDSSPSQGVLRSAVVDASYHNSLTSEVTERFVPWTALQHGGPAGDGFFVATESLSSWNISVVRDDGAAVSLALSPLGWANYRLPPGERVELPLLTAGVFTDGLDGMGARLYDWQYQYLWDYTNPDYYARPQHAVPWFYCSRNLQEQFAARLARLDMDGADHMRAAGISMLWDDAGWAKYPGWPVPDNYGSVFHHAYDGPDFSQTQRYLRKMDMRWLVWFCGRPSPAVMDARIAAWGDFQWRTDGVGHFTPATERVFLDNIKRFLDSHPRASFHTCSGGSRYSHTFEIQRYADINYLADYGRGDETNYYFSYLDPPDKWIDILESIPDMRYRPDTSRHMLTMVPSWAYANAEADMEFFRQDMELYQFLLREGVAGRWSYVFHPAVAGDSEHYYFQRTSRDRRRACIILKHRAKGEVTVYPRGLLPEHDYVLGFDSAADTSRRSGSDLATNGITLRDQKPREMIYLGLPNRPGGKAARTAPHRPDRALKRFETNLGHAGVGIYWSSGEASGWIGSYEVRRGDTFLGRTSIGRYHFDHSPGWDPAAPYSVRACAGSGVASGWTEAEPIEGEPLTYPALGGHFPERGRDGWSAQTTDDATVFRSMDWVPPARNPAADIDGGTPNQVGGVEGYWESGSARVGRGWQQASTTSACIRSWTAPQRGTVRVVGRAMKECYHQGMGGPLRIWISHGERRVWPREGPAEVRPNDMAGVAHDFEVAVQKGDTIRFVLEKGNEPDNDIVAWLPRITYASEGTPVHRPDTGWRIFCGSSSDYVDSCGNVWSKDMLYSGGETVSTQDHIEGALPTPEDAPLYGCGREGEDFSYSFPVKAGLYTVRLKFAETRTHWMHERPIDISANGRRLVSGFDICHIARGSRRACEKTFHNVVPDARGFVTLRFTSGADPLKTLDKAVVQAIEVLPEIRPEIRINSGSESPFVDWNGAIWLADAFFEGGRGIASDAPVNGAFPTLYDQKLYQTARTGKSFLYRVAAPPGLYTVHLKFAELWPKEGGSRRMNVDVNGLRIREDWDPAQSSGGPGTAVDITVGEVAPDHDGQIRIVVSACTDIDAVLQGFELT